MRLLFLDSWPVSRALGSGSAVAIAGLASGLRSLGHDVHILRPRRAYLSLEITRLAFNLSLKRRLASMRGRYDLVVGFDYDGFAHGGTLGVPYVVALKGVAADERRFEKGWPRLWFRLWTALEARNARSADCVVVTSEYSRRRAVASYRLNPGRVRVVPEAVDPGMAGGSAAARRFDVEDVPTILSVARQYRRKDTATLIRALPRVQQALPATRLRIVGGGPELPALRRLTVRLGLRDSVDFLDSIETSEALKLEYERASVFCLPSLQEGFGIVFLEAMSNGLPIVAARAGAVPEVAPHGETSLLVEPGDADGLADAILRILTDSSLAARLGRAGVGRAVQYTWPHAATAFLKALQIEKRS